MSILDSLSLSSSARATLLQATERYETAVYELAEFLGARGIDEKAALSARLGRVSDPLPEHERHKGMLAIPYLTPAGPVAIKFRCVEDHECKEHGHAKYDAPAGQHARLYNVAALHSDGDVVAVCEGELDALVMSEVVGIPAIGIPGASHWQDHWARAFADYERVLILADNDSREDGSNPGLRHAEKLAKKIPGSRVVLPPKGMDASEWVLEHGMEEVRNACGY